MSVHPVLTQSPAPSETSPPADAVNVHPRLLRSIILGDNIIVALILYSLWALFRDWSAMGLVLALHVARGVMNALLIKRFGRQLQGRAGSNLWAIINLCFSLLILHFGRWTPAALLHIPYAVATMENLAAWDARLRLGLWLLMVSGTAALVGVPLASLLPMLVLAVVFYGVFEARWRVLAGSLEKAEDHRRRAVRAHGELEKMHQQLVEQEKLSSIGLLAAGVAHEINNPMSYVTSNISGLMKDLPRLPQDPALLKEYMEDVIPATMDGARRVNTIVADLLRFARGDPEAGLVEYDLNAEVETAGRIARSRMGEHCCTELDLEPLPRVLGRPQQIVQVLVNLLVNAAQASPRDGRVRVRTRAEGQSVVISVSDNGVGMPPEVRGKLFQPFFSTKPVGEGTGLGLSVAHGIIRSHGGTIEVESEPQKGTTFTLRLPCAPPASGASGPSPAQPLGGAGSDKASASGSA